MHNIIRYILAVCFIISGIMKAVSIKAFEQEVQLYGDAYIGEWLHDYSFPVAVVVCAAEITVGIAALWRRFALHTGVTFCIMLTFFVYLTGTNLFFPTIMGSIETCGCFGELIHFTPVSAFVKSAVLMCIAVINLFAVVKTGRDKE